MKILLSGATGFVGRALGLELVRLGHEVLALVRDPGKTKLPFLCQLVSWGDEKLPPGIEAVIHLAGEPIAGRWTKEKKEKIYNSRINTTRDLISKLQNEKIGIFISTSAVGFYGDRGEELLTESGERGSGFLSDVCVAWENEASKAEQALAARVAIFRLGMVLGRGGGALQEMLPIFNRGFGGHLGNGKQWMSWIELDDLVALFCFALTHELRGIYNAVSPEVVSNSEFTKCLSAVLRKPAIIPVPAFALRLALGEMSSLLLVSQKVSCAKSIEAGFSFRYQNLQSALEKSVS